MNGSRVKQAGKDMVIILIMAIFVTGAGIAPIFFVIKILSPGESALPIQSISDFFATLLVFAVTSSISGFLGGLLSLLVLRPFFKKEDVRHWVEHGPKIPLMSSLTTKILNGLYRE